MGRYLAAVGQDYGVGLGSNQDTHLDGGSPLSIDDTQLPDGGLSALNNLIDGRLGNILPAPTANSVYMGRWSRSCSRGSRTWSSCV